MELNRLKTTVGGRGWAGVGRGGRVGMGIGGCGCMRLKVGGCMCIPGVHMHTHTHTDTRARTHAHTHTHTRTTQGEAEYGQVLALRVLKQVFAQVSLHDSHQVWEVAQVLSTSL